MRASIAGFLLLTFFCGSLLGAQRPIDAQRSVMKVFAFKSGLFSGFAHDHEILAPIDAGGVEDSGSLSVELRMKTSRMRVLDPKASDKDRAAIRDTMLSADVLDVSAFPEVRFRSNKVEPSSNGHWTVNGSLDLHGQTRPLTLEVVQENGSYRGSAKLKQSDFGIKPISLFGGTVKVKDEVRVDFEIVLAP